MELFDQNSGILFVQISQQDIENFKKEYDMRQKDGNIPKKPEITTDSPLKSESIEKSSSPDESSQSPAVDAS